MKLTQLSPQLRFHPDAYRFVFEALQYMQEKLRKPRHDDVEDESAHLSGQELLVGIRELGLHKYGLMARWVFRHWGVHSTEDFGRIVFELVDRGEMRKTDRDRINDFLEVYEFEEALDQAYDIPAHLAFE